MAHIPSRLPCIAGASSFLIGLLYPTYQSNHKPFAQHSNTPALQKPAPPASWHALSIKHPRPTMNPATCRKIRNQKDEPRHNGDARLSAVCAFRDQPKSMCMKAQPTITHGMVHPPPYPRFPFSAVPSPLCVFAPWRLCVNSALRTPRDYKKSSNKIAARRENRVSDRPYINRGSCIRAPRTRSAELRIQTKRHQPPSLRIPRTINSQHSTINHPHDHHPRNRPPRQRTR